MFEFVTTQRIVFGNGSIARLPETVRGFGRRVLLVTGSRIDRYERIVAALRAEVSTIELCQIVREPTVSDIEEAVGKARLAHCDVIVGLGGGSAVDAAKAVAAVCGNPGELLDYLEVVGRAQPLTMAGLPCIAVPTTAGTGAEVTRNSVIDVPEHATKVSLRGPQVLPRVAIVDPALMTSVPSNVTATTGFDALTQVIEPYLSRQANPLTDVLALQGIRLAARALPRVCSDGQDLLLREDMAQASMLGGMCLTNAGLGAVHGLAGPIGGLFRAPHGAVCAALLAPTLARNLAVIRESSCSNRADLLERFAQIARLLLGRADAEPEDAANWVSELATRLQISKLSNYGVNESRFGEIIERARVASSMKFNAVPLSVSDLTEVLHAAL